MINLIIYTNTLGDNMKIFVSRRWLKSDDFHKTDNIDLSESEKVEKLKRAITLSIPCQMVIKYSFFNSPEPEKPDVFAVSVVKGMFPKVKVLNGGEESLLDLFDCIKQVAEFLEFRFPFKLSYMDSNYNDIYREFNRENFQIAFS